MNSEHNAYSIFHAQRTTGKRQFAIIDGRAVRINREMYNANTLYQLNLLPQSPILYFIENNIWREKSAINAPAWPQKISFNYNYPTPLIPE